MIGTWGNVVFVASADVIKTFDAFKRTESARWAKHDIHLQKSKAEFLGVNAGKVTFTMRFDAFYGLNPREELNKLVKYVRSGEAHQLIIGGKRVGVGKWYHPDTNQDWNFFDNYGNVLVGSVTVNLEEYV